MLTQMVYDGEDYKAPDRFEERSLSFTALELKESFPHGGTLIAREAGFELLFYFPGPDLRYNGTFLKIEGALLHQYIEAWHENWLTFKEMYMTMPDVSFAATGTHGMRINISGIRLQGLLVASDDELGAMVAVFQRALERGKELQHEICQRVGRPLIADVEKLAYFDRFKSGESLARSTNPAVVRELGEALGLVRSKLQGDVQGCRHKVRNWFGRAAAEEFMADVRLHGLDVFNEQADFVISWRGRQ